MTHSCEILVIGSGPGGAISACLLAEAGRDVLLLEEGPHLQLHQTEPFSREEMTQKYRNGGLTPMFGRGGIAYVEGRCVGGGSEINSGLYHRTPAEILGKWQRNFDVEHCSSEEMQPYFEACERDVAVGFLPNKAPVASLKLAEGAKALGWQAVEIPRWSRYLPVASEPGKWAEKRQSMTQTYLPRFLNAGGKLLPKTRAQLLRQEGVGWDVECPNGVVRAETIFVCAGATQTPLLLRKSGISENIGNSLQVHPTVKMCALFEHPVNGWGMGVPVHQIKEFSPDLSFGCSISTPPYLALGLAAAGSAHLLEENWTRMANYYAMIVSPARGTVRRVPGFTDALVRYSLASGDFRKLAEGLRKLGEVLFAAGAVSVYPSISGFKPMYRPEDLSQLGNMLPEGRTQLMTIHLFSSCPMGENRSVCATDSFGKVHGFENLYINDASLLCTAPSVNPQGSVMAIARRNVLRFLNQL